MVSSGSGSAPHLLLGGGAGDSGAVGEVREPGCTRLRKIVSLRTSLCRRPPTPHSDALQHTPTPATKTPKGKVLSAHQWCDHNSGGTQRSQLSSSPTHCRVPSPKQISATSPTQLRTQSPLRAPSSKQFPVSPRQTLAPTSTHYQTTSPTHQRTPSSKLHRPKLYTPSLKHVPATSSTQFRAPSPKQTTSSLPKHLRDQSLKQLPVTSSIQSRAESRKHISGLPSTQLRAQSLKQLPVTSLVQSRAQQPKQMNSPPPIQLRTQSLKQIPVKSPVQSRAPSPKQIRSPSPVQLRTQSLKQIPVESSVQSRDASPKQISDPSSTHLREQLLKQVRTPSPMLPSAQSQTQRDFVRLRSTPSLQHRHLTFQSEDAPPNGKNNGTQRLSPLQRPAVKPTAWNYRVAEMARRRAHGDPLSSVRSSAKTTSSWSRGWSSLVQDKIPRHSDGTSASSSEDDWKSDVTPLWLKSFTHRVSLSHSPSQHFLPGGQRAKTIPLVPPFHPRTPSRPLRLLQDVTSTLTTSASNTRHNVTPISRCMSPRRTAGNSQNKSQRDIHSPKSNVEAVISALGTPSTHDVADSRDSAQMERRRKSVPVEPRASPRRRANRLPRLLLDARSVPERFAGARERIMGTRNYLRLFFPNEWQEMLRPPLPPPAPPPSTHASRTSGLSSAHSEVRLSPWSADKGSASKRRRRSGRKKSAQPPPAPPLRPRVQYFPQLTRHSASHTSNITIAQYISNVMCFMRDSYFRSADDESGSPLTE